MPNTFDSPREQNLSLYIVSLLIAHIISGVFQTPPQIIESGLTQGLSKLSICIGYSFGIFALFAIVSSVLYLTVVFFVKFKHKTFYFKKELCKTLLITLALNFLVGFIIVPKIL